MAHDVFVCYSRKDQEIIDALTSQLQGAGFSIWVDRDGIHGGTPSWQAAITEAICQCSAVLCGLSSASIGSDDVQRELKLAYEEKKPILPVLLEAVDSRDMPGDVRYVVRVAEAS